METPSDAAAVVIVTPRRSGGWRIAAVLLLIAVGWFACGKGPTDPCPTCGGGGGTAVLVGAGDIAACDPTPSAGTVATARMLDGLYGWGQCVPWRQPH